MFGRNDQLVELLCLIGIATCFQVAFLLSSDGGEREVLRGIGTAEFREGLEAIINVSEEKLSASRNHKRTSRSKKEKPKKKTKVTTDDLEQELQNALTIADDANEKLSHIQKKHLEEEITFATNTVDKLMYEIKNFDTHNNPPFASPQFNPPPLRHVKNNLNLLIGISTVNRKKQNYLYGTVSNIMERVSEEEKKAIKIIIMNGNVPATDHEDVLKVREDFKKEIQSGLIVIKEHKEPYPQLKNTDELTLRWGDTKDRVYWRSKQVLDVSSLMNFASEYPEYGYFLMLEDDVKVAESFPTAIRTWTDEHLSSRTDWLVGSFYNPWKVKDMEVIPNYNFFGVIGQLFRIHDLPHVTDYLLKNFDESPLDWLFVDYLTKYNKSMIAHSPSLFQHLGVVSSLANKVQPSRAAVFDEFPLKH